MGQVHYMISEAAKRVSVESHVLRYWEEELGLAIGRTEMGHRYYTQEDIQLFNCIRELKETGLLLKDLKVLIPDLIRTREKLQLRRQQEDTPPVGKGIPPKEGDMTPKEGDISPVDLAGPEDMVPPSNQEIFQRALLENNKILESALTQAVSEAVAAEMDLHLKGKDLRDEERYQKLDCLIRQQQSLHREAMRPAPLRNLRRLFET